jgi:thioredoxin-related protein
VTDYPLMKLLCILFAAWTLLSGCQDLRAQKVSDMPPVQKDHDGNWMHNLSSAISKAKTNGRPLLVMISEPSCRWCLKMKHGALSDPRVQEVMKKYILVKVRRSDHAQSGRIKAFDGKIPSFFVLTSEGEVVDSIVGYYRTEDFLHYLQEISGEME